MTTDTRRAGHFAGRSLLGLVAVLAAGCAFGTVLLLVRYHWAPMIRLDQGVTDRLNALVAPHPAAVKALTVVSMAGGPAFVTGLAVLGTVLLLIRRRPRLAAYLAVTGLGAALLDPSIKTLVGRVRPVVAVPVAHGGGNSFPSGHTLGATIVYGALALIVVSRTRRWPAVVAGLIVVAVGLSRVGLGVHFLSDVLGGWLLGCAWVGVTAYAFRVWRREAGKPTPPLAEGLEPEAAADLAPAPGEGEVLPHPWAKGAGILVGWVLTFGLLYLLGQVLTHRGPGAWDDAVPRWLQGFRTPWLDHLSLLLSRAGDTHAILAVSLVFCPLALALWRQWRPVLFVVLAMVGEITLFLLSAAATGRPRPPVAQLDGHLPTSSFPSGHVAATLCLWAAIAIVSMPRARGWWRWAFLVPAIGMPLLVAVSRMYRGMHHPTDVLGAVVLAGCWLGVLYLAVRPTPAPDPVRPALPRTGSRPPARAERASSAGRPPRRPRRSRPSPEANP
jgi:undecaprenyl-diphosphatase